MTATAKVDFAALRKKSRLPSPPEDASRNLAEPELPGQPASPPPAPSPPATPPAPRSRPHTPPPQEDAPTDGRSLRKTGRTEPFATRVRADFRPRVMRLAALRGCTMAEVLELALDELERATPGASPPGASARD